MGRTARKTVTGRRGKSRAAIKARTAGKSERSALAQPPVMAIVSGRERTLKSAEIELLQKTVAKGTTPEEFLYFMTVCKKHRVDPFTKQIYCIVWPTEHGNSHEVVIIMGIGGYRMTAARDHKDFAGTSAPKFTWPATEMKTPAGRRIPESATVSALRKGGEPSEATVFWEEFAPVDLKAKRSDFWNRLPKHMLAKCAESHAIRKAFPDLSDIYTEEELSQRLQDLTPGGREISHGGVAPSGKVLDNGYGAAKAAQQAVLDEKLGHGHPQGSQGAKHAEAALERNEAEDARLAAARNITPGKRGASQAQEKPKPKPPEAGATLHIGTIHRVVQGMTKDRHVPYVSIRLNGVWHNCWSKTLQKFFPNEVDLVSTVAELWIDASQNIVGIKRLGSLHFEDDGRTPRRREPGEDE